MESTTLGEKGWEKTDSPVAADDSSISPQQDETHIMSTANGDESGAKLGTPQERLEMLQQEIRNCIAAGMQLTIGNATRAGRSVLVIGIYDARIVDDHFRFSETANISPRGEPFGE